MSGGVTVLATAILLVLTRPVSAQITGRVIDARTGTGVAGAAVQLLLRDSVPPVLTNKDGAFSLNTDPERSVRVSRIGYRPIEARLQDLMAKPPLVIQLEPDPLPVAGIEVKASRNRWLEANGFFARQRVGGGRFITRETIEKRHRTAIRGGDILRTVSGVAYVNTNNADFDIVYMRASHNIRGACPARVFVNGLNVDHVPRMHPDNIEAIEVYRGPAEVPPQFGGAQSACGVILLWTRTGGG
jgi:hypothetical protein